MHEQRHATQRKEFGSDRNDHTVGRGQRVHRQQAQRWLAVDDDHVVLVLDLAQHTGKHLLTFGDQLHFGGGQIDVGRHNVEILEIGVVNHAVHVHARIEQRRVHGVLHRVGVDAETHRGGALRIEVDDQHAPAVLA